MGLDLAQLGSDGIDRVSPTRQPQGLRIMRQNWHHLLFLHWEVDPTEVQALLPPGLTVDTFDGKAYVGLVPFTITGVRPVCMPPAPWVSYFHETNVRTYVHVEGHEPGVWFFSLDAANPAVVPVARAWYKLPYFYAGIEMDRSPTSGEISYSLRRISPPPTPASCNVWYRPTGTPAPARVGTLEHFLVERYILYSYSKNILYRARVHHRPYPLKSAHVGGLNEDLVRAAGLQQPVGNPLIHYSRGVKVVVLWPELVKEN